MQRVSGEAGKIKLLPCHLVLAWLIFYPHQVQIPGTDGPVAADGAESVLEGVQVSCHRQSLCSSFATRVQELELSDQTLPDGVVSRRIGDAGHF